VRPNEIEFLRPEEQEAPNVFEACVEKLTYLGDTMDYRLRFGDDLALRVQSDARHRYGQGATVRIRLPRIRSWTLTES